MKDNKELKVLDLFCGCGGLSLGFEMAGFRIVAGVDSWIDALDTFQRNHNGAKAVKADLFSKTPKDIVETIQEDIDVVVGGPPCQGFSIAGKRMIDDPRNLLYKSFVEFVNVSLPRAFVMENVPNIISMNNGAIKSQIIEDFNRIGYKVLVQVLDSSEYGVPQKRRRAIFVGIRKDSNREFTFPKGDNSVITTAEAISDLPEGGLSDGAGYPTSTCTSYQAQMRMNSSGVFNHQPAVHNDKTVEIIRQVPDGGNYKSLPLHLHNTRKVNIAWTRMNSSKPCFTIDTGHNHHFHYLYNRVPTARESARIQSFPDNFIFTGNKGSQLKQIGNAVPPLLAKQIAISLKRVLI